MGSTPFMPLWVSDFLGDTLDLDASEVGAYMLLLMAQWNRAGDSLPNDDKKLQRVARCGRNWVKVWANISRYFDEDENGIYSQRLRQESQNVAAKREVNSHNGARGGKAKALKQKELDLANATNSPERNPSIPEPYPYKKERGAKAPSDLEADDGLKDCLEHFNKTAERVGWPQVQKFSKPRASALAQRVKDIGGADNWREAIDRAALSPLLTGQKGNGWKADFDWLAKPANFTKLLEGNYDPRDPNGPRGPNNNQQRLSQGRQDGLDPAIANIARLAGLR